jgi:hypothetical protein
MELTQSDWGGVNICRDVQRVRPTFQLRKKMIIDELNAVLCNMQLDRLSS